MLGLSFLGPTKYQEASYYWVAEDKNTLAYETDLFPEVLPGFFSLTKLIIFVTKEVENHENCRRLKARLGNLMKTVSIPSGKTEKELWDIYSIVAEQVPSRAHLIIDITHAFRALPLIVFNVATYLRRIKNVEVKRIVYGNFEARDINFTPPRVPVFDLTSTLDLQNWLHGIDAFQRRGEAEELADSLSITQGRLHQTVNIKSTMLPRKLKHTARQLKNFSEALRLLRPLETSLYAADLCNLLEIVQDEASLWAKPFADVLHDLKNEISPIQNKESTALNGESLKAQLRLIHYYLDKDLVVQAVLLAREWVVSSLMFKTNRHENWRDRGARKTVEIELGLVVKVAVQKEISETAVKLPLWYRQDPHSQNIAEIWNRLSGLRNDIAHCAMSADAASTDAIRNNIKVLIPLLKDTFIVN